jgi:hypothetical protein
MSHEFKSWLDFVRFSESVRHSSRYIHGQYVNEFLATLLQTSNARHRTLAAGKFLWRAQLGGAANEREQDGVVWDELVPYQSERMAPRTNSAHEGRANPKGIPCLYLATDKETAMAEVRTWIGISLSAGQFRLTKDINVVDFSVGHDKEFDFYFEEPLAEEREKSVWLQVDRAFSEPTVTDPATADYVPTQVISEFFKENGFDGVAYKSRLGKGFNFALFDQSVATLVNCALFPVKSVSFEFGEPERAYSVKN